MIQAACWTRRSACMVKPYSNDLRERVVKAVLAGDSCGAAADRFGVSKSSAIKWTRLFRRTGDVSPGKMGGHRKPVLEPHRAFIFERLRQTPHLSVVRLRDELAARGVEVSHDTVWRFLKSEGFSFKKKACSPLNRPVATWLGDAGAGRRSSLTSIRKGLSSSMKPGSRPTWPH